MALYQVRVSVVLVCNHCCWACQLKLVYILVFLLLVRLFRYCACLYDYSINLLPFVSFNRPALL
jgi:hypothetical protein